MAEGQERRNTHYPALDGLRGIAVLVVLFHHFARFTDYGFGVGTFKRGLSESMHIGVDLFFVLSGFLITTILLNSRTSPRYYKSFYGRRVLRIIPLYYLFLLSCFYLLPALGLLERSGNQWWFFLFVPNMLFVRAGWAMQVLNPLWSIGIEEQFYLVWPWVVSKRQIESLLIVLVIVIVSQPFLRFALDHLMVYIHSLTHLDGIAMGSLLAILLYKKAIKFDKLSKPAAIILTLFVLYLLARAMWPLEMLSTEHGWYGQHFDSSVLAIAFGYLLILAISPTTNLIQKIGMNRFLSEAGRKSYAMYIFHMLVLHFFLFYEINSKSLSSIFGANILSSIVWMALLMAATWAVAWLSWHLIEKRFLALKVKFPY